MKSWELMAILSSANAGAEVHFCLDVGDGEDYVTAEPTVDDDNRNDEEDASVIIALKVPREHLKPKSKS